MAVKQKWPGSPFEGKRPNLSISGDAGDVTTLTIAPGEDPEYILFGTDLTGDCVVTITPVKSIKSGDTFVIVRSGAGAGNLTINYGESTEVYAMTTSQESVRIIFDGSVWQVVEISTLS